MGYASPGCQGNVVWYGTGSTERFCQNVPAMAASFRWGAMKGVQFITSPQYAVCDSTALIYGDGDGATVTTVLAPSGVRQLGCVNGLIQAYRVTYVPWVCC